MNLSSQVKALHLVQLEYEDTIQLILPYFYDTLNKNQQIRIRQWIKKLSSVINNILWRKNRNLYAKYLYGMLKTKSGLIQPFNKCPPDGSLAKLSIYEIPYNLKLFIQNYDREYRLKQQLKQKCKSIQKLSRTQANKQNLMEVINRQKQIKQLQRSMRKQKQMNKTIIKSTGKQQKLRNKKFSLTTQHINLEKQNFKYQDNYNFSINKHQDYRQKNKTINYNSINKYQNFTQTNKYKELNNSINKYKDHSQTKKISHNNFNTRYQQPKVNANEVNELLAETLQFLNDNYQLILKNQKNQQQQKKQISKLKSLIIKINSFQQKIQQQSSHQNSLQSTNNIIQKLFR